MLIMFTSKEKDAQVIRWGSFTAHKGFMQGLAFADYLLQNAINIEDFSVTITDGSQEPEEYSVQEYFEKFGEGMELNVPSWRTKKIN